MLIDTHAHTYEEDFFSDIDLVVQNAENAGVSKVLLPNIDLDSIEKMNVLVSKYPNTFIPMMGLHPCYVKEGWESDLKQIKDTLYENPNRFCAVGEIGLDYHWDTSLVDAQKFCFQEQLEWSAELKKPVSIHTRKSLFDVISVLKKNKEKQLQGVIHCFSGSLEEAKQVLDLGFYLGIGGVVTFKNAGVAEVIKEIDLKYLVLETDAPYLAPAPHRGKRNENSYVRIIAEKIAEIKDVSLEEVSNVTTQNACNLFGISI